MGHRLTSLIARTLSAPVALSEKNYDDLVKLLKEHHNPKPSTIVQRYRFNSRRQEEGETITAYVAALRKLAEHCEFNESMNDMLRDRLVCGVNHERIQRALLAEKYLTFEGAFQKARAMETVARTRKKYRRQQLSPPPPPPRLKRLPTSWNHHNH